MTRPTTGGVLSPKLEVCVEVGNIVVALNSSGIPWLDIVGEFSKSLQSLTPQTEQ